MGRALLVLWNDAMRAKAADWIARAPKETRVTFQGPKRSLDQNSNLWACLTDIAQQVEWYGQKLSTEDWKDMFTASLRKARVVPGLDAGSFVLLGLHTSTMDKEELGNLLELIAAFGAQHGVTFHESQSEAA